MAAFGAAPAPANPNNSFEVPCNPAPDGISSLSFHPHQNYLIGTSWDNQVRCWEIQQNGQAVPKSATNHAAPVLCSAWSADGNSVFSGGCDNQAKKWDLASNQSTQVAQHDAPIRHLAWVQELNMLVTGSWDKTIRYWDLRQQSPAHTQALPDKCYAMSVVYPLLVVGTAERHIQIYNMNQPSQVYKQLQTPLRYQTRTVACFPDKTGYLIGSIEGRVAVQHIDESMNAKNFTFKCHREEQDIYAVNHLCFHPNQGTFVTAGSDGTFNFWDKENKQRLKAMAKCPAPIPTATFNHDGTILAYAVSYDWSKGAEAHNPQNAVNKIYLHAVQEGEVKQRIRKK